MAKKSNSRPARWAAAAAAAREALDKITEAKAELENAMSDLNDLKSEYEEWRDNMPEGLQSSPLGEKLQTVCDIDFEVELDTDPIENAISEAESADLPRGFGQD